VAEDLAFVRRDEERERALVATDGPHELLPLFC
jgi:hypothetical protein